MNLRDFATHYARYASSSAMADNAPSELRQLLGEMGRRTDSVLVTQAVQQLAGQTEPTTPSIPTILALFAAFPAAAASLDDVLRSKKPPQSFQELAERAYQDHYQLILKEVRAWMMARLHAITP